jgi:hypothetical protein
VLSVIAPPGVAPDNDDTTRTKNRSTPMIIHSATVELHPTDIRLLTESGLPLAAAEPGRGDVLPIGRADLASRLRAARARTDDPDRRAVIVSFLKQLRA